MEPSNLQVVVMGLVIVFICLIVLIALIYIMSAVINTFTKNKQEPVKDTTAPKPSQPAVIVADSDRQKTVAAISVAIAEYMGTDVSHIKIHSIKKV